MSTISIEGEKTNGSKGFALRKLFIGMIEDAKVVLKGEPRSGTAVEEEVSNMPLCRFDSIWGPREDGEG